MDNIRTPEELLDFMSNNIKYGYLGKTGRVYHKEDNDFNSSWESEYVLQTDNELLDTLYGNCYDQVELERYWFFKNNYEIKTFFEIVKLDYKNDYPSHAFLIFKNGNKWCWFENADILNKGIHSFDSLEELLEYQYNKYLEFLKTFNIKDEEINKIVVKEFNKPKYHTNANKYLEYVLCEDN